MRLLTSALCTALAAGLLAACSGGSASAPTAPGTMGAENHLINGHFVPGFSRTANPIPVELRTWNPQRVLSKIVPDKEEEGQGRHLRQPVLRGRHQRLQDQRQRPDLQ